MHEYIPIAQRHKRELTEIGVCGEIFERVQLYVSRVTFITDFADIVQQSNVQLGPTVDMLRIRLLCFQLNDIAGQCGYTVGACGVRGLWRCPNDHALFTPAFRKGLQPSEVVYM